MMLRIMLAASAVLLQIACAPRMACADGGTLQTMQQAGDYHISVFTSPTVLRAGLVDISVLLQEAGTGKVVHDAAITLVAVPQLEFRNKIQATATRQAATNKLLSAATIKIPDPGFWDVTVMCQRPNAKIAESIKFSMHIGTAWGGPHKFWSWISLPAIPIALFIAHRVLVWRASRHNKAAASNASRLLDHRPGERGH